MSMQEAIDVTHLSETRSHNTAILPTESGYELLEFGQVEEDAPKRSKTRLVAILIGLYVSLTDSTKHFSTASTQ
jgi:hypothetical protein